MRPRFRQFGAVFFLATIGLASTANAYQWQINEDTSFAIGGDIEIAYIHQQQLNKDAGKIHSVRELIDNGSELDFSGEHTFKENLTAYFHAAFEFRDDESGVESQDYDSAFKNKEAYFGLRSNFGALQVGDWDGVYEDNVEDLLDVFEVSEPTHSELYRTGEIGDAVAYFSPAYKGFAFAIQAFFKGEGEGENFDDNPGADSDQAFQAVIKYETEMYGVYLGYDNNGLDQGGKGTFGVGASLDLDPWSFAAKIESVGEDSDPISKLDAEGFMVYGVTATYNFGRANITGAVNQVEPGSDALDSRTEFGIKISYNLADSFYIYAEHFRYDREDDLDNITGAGLVYEF